MASLLDNLRDVGRMVGLPAQRDRIEKLSVTQMPERMEAALESQGMSTTTPLGPGVPIQPVDGYSTHPRVYNYRSGYNISAMPRIQEDVSFDTLRGLIGSYDIAALCISHRIEALRSYDWILTPTAGTTADVSDVTKLVRQVLAYPDRELPFRTWLHKYLYDVLAYDAGTLYRERNRGGQVIGLTVIDGTTIAPTLDAWGRIPGRDPETGEWAPAYRQYIQGMAWSWLTKQDLIYIPFSPRASTPYGQAPLERILLNANLDLRFQVFFMERFTKGNIPQMFASAPENWTPQQVDDWQSRWDAMLRGNQGAQQQVKWVPGGSKFDFVNRDEYKHDFSMWLLQKTAAAYHVVPADLGWTEKVNKANGQTQADVSEKFGDRPLEQHVEDVISGFLQHDLGVPLEFHFDQGTNDQNALLTAQSDQIYVNMGAVSVSDVRAARYGLAEPAGDTIPRFVMTSSGPMPLSMIIDESTPVDQATGAPEPGTTRPGSAPQVPVAPTAPQPVASSMAQRAAVAKAIEPRDAVRRELGAFRRFVKSRDLGSWRPFRFEHVDVVRAHRLNVGAYSTLRKDAGQISVAGLAVVAQDTGRVLLLQRALDADDPNGGYWELPGGHLEPGETPGEGACREWCEEVAQPLPEGVLSEAYTGTGGQYEAFVLLVSSEDCVQPADREGGPVNPDDPDGDNVEAVAWWDPKLLVNNPGVRPALAVDISRLLQAVGDAVKDAPDVPEVPDAGAGGVVPFQKASWRDSADKWPGHRYDLALTDHYMPDIESALAALVASVDVSAVAAALPGLVQKSAAGALVRAVLKVPAKVRGLLVAAVTKMRSEAYVTGVHSGAKALGVDYTVGVDWDSWKPGDALAASKTVNLAGVLGDAGVRVDGITDTVLNMIGNRIAAGLAAGEPHSQIAADLTGIPASRAETIAHTEVARAQTSAAFDVYRAANVSQYDLLTADGAEQECVDLAGAGPYDIDDPTAQVPIHPRCRCADSPHTDESTLTGADLTDAITSAVTVPNQ